MSIWFVIRAPNPTALDQRINLFRATYSGAGVRNHTNPDEDEQVGTMHKDATETAAYCGSSRVDSPTAQQVGRAHASWLEIHETPEFLETWDYPPGPDD